MKMTKVALAAVALLASTASFATEVKLSGQMDVGVFHTSKNADGQGGTFVEQGGLLDHSSIQLDVSEDLGSGLKAFVVLEAGFNANGSVDNGGTQGSTVAGNTTLFNRQSFLGLSSDAVGTVGIGKQLSPFILSQALTNFGVGSFWVNRLAVGNAGNGGGFAAGGAGLNVVGFFPTNAITYTSPSIAGFTLRGMTTTKAGTKGNVLEDQDNANRYDSLSISGNVGPAFVSAAWQERKDAYKSWTIGATATVLEGLSVMANYINDKNSVSDLTVKSWAVGAKYSLVAGTDAILQYAQGDQDDKVKLVNLTLTHALSKRTTAYATAARGTNVGSALGNFGNTYTGESNKSYGVGIAHSF